MWAHKREGGTWHAGGRVTEQGREEVGGGASRTKNKTTNSTSQMCIKTCLKTS